MLIGIVAACAGAAPRERYLGISLEPGQDPELVALARAAQAGDARAQIGLAHMFERNYDLRRAERLYLAAGRSAAADEVAAQARAGWIRVRSERLARQAAEAPPGGFSDEIFYARKLAVERALGDTEALALPVAEIRGPVTVSGRFERTGFERGEAELCRALEPLIRRYWRWGFEDCIVERYARSGGAARGEPPLVAVSYDDRHTDDPNYMGHPHEFRWPTFALSLDLSGTEPPFCGRFTAYDFVLSGGSRYRLLHAAAPGEPRTGRRCPRVR